MDCAKIFLIMSLLIIFGDAYKPKCLSVPALPAKVELHIKSCQSEIKSNIIDDLLHTTLNDNPYSSIEYGDLLKPHIEHLHSQHKSKHKHHYNDFAEHIKKPLNHHHDYEYFEQPDQSQAFLNEFSSFQNTKLKAALPTSYSQSLFDEFASVRSTKLKSSTPSTINNYQDSHLIHSTFPEYVIDHNYHITPSIRFATPATEVEDRNEKLVNNQDKIVEANEELRKILGNHKLYQRQINRKDKRNSYKKSNSTEKRSKRSERSILGYFNRNNQDDEFLLKKTATGAAEFHPSLLTDADKWLAGCLMQCIFRKTHALDKYGYPSLDGIVDLYTEGIHDQFYFMYALKAVNKCLKIVSKKHKILRSKLPPKFETCEIAFDVFDCVSDAITAYCH